MVVSPSVGLSDRALVALLADGCVHSGERLARSLGVSRAAVWKGVERLRADGIEVLAEPRLGYRLPAAVELLEEGRIGARIDPARRGLLRGIEVLFDVDSTNTFLLRQEPPPPGRGDACCCELQRAGRGRRGRRWLAPFGQGIAISLGWQFRGMPRDLPALGLATGTAVARSLARVGARGIGLKWPNDVTLQGAKLGGVLIDLRAEADGPVHVVIGVGLNLSLTAAARAEIAATGVCAAAIADACATPPSRNEVAGTLFDELLRLVAAYECSGFAALREEWSALDVFADRRAVLSIGSDSVHGIARGIDHDGALRVEVDGVVRKFLSGDLSLRPEDEIH